jgi:hypothetical protein
VRRDAELELPHILVLIDDPDCSVIEPLAADRAALTPLYDTPLMAGGGHVSGHALSPAQGKRLLRALKALADPQAFAKRYDVPAHTPPMLFAVGDGNHSLATAKAIWQQARATVGLQHPSRFALVEVVNIHDPALAFEPIHRLLFGVSADPRQALAEAYGAGLRCTDVASGEAMRQRLREHKGTQSFGLIGPGERFAVIEIDEPPSSLAVGTVQAFVDDFIARGAATQVDYVHGDDVLERLGRQPSHVGLHLDTVGKSELLKRVVLEGPLPRKTFSMGEAHEKRFYIEARRIR